MQTVPGTCLSGGVFQLGVDGGRLCHQRPVDHIGKLKTRSGGDSGDSAAAPSLSDLLGVFVRVLQ